MNKVMSQDEYTELYRDLSKPINYEELISSGALIKKGNSYYIVNYELLPEYATKKIKELSQTKNGAKVMFYK